jgi:hypothetical protein
MQMCERKNRGARKKARKIKEREKRAQKIKERGSAEAQTQKREI